jgi:hypothetical protein
MILYSPDKRQTRDPKFLPEKGLRDCNHLHGESITTVHEGGLAGGHCASA